MCETSLLQNVFEAVVIRQFRTFQIFLITSSRLISSRLDSRRCSAIFLTLSIFCPHVCHRKKKWQGLLSRCSETFFVTKLGWPAFFLPPPAVIRNWLAVRYDNCRRALISLTRWRRTKQGVDEVEQIPKHMLSFSVWENDNVWGIKFLRRLFHYLPQLTLR